MMRHTMAMAGLAVAASLVAGCLSSRHIVGIQDHADKNVTLIETLDHWTYFPGLSEELIHQFWRCDESDAGLKCEKSCGGDTGLQCPTGTILATGVGSNVR